MLKRYLLLLSTPMISALFLWFLLNAAESSARAYDHQIDFQPSSVNIFTPTIERLDPTSAPNNIDQLLNIYGANFVFSGTAPLVKLGRYSLEAQTPLTSTMITATVPWGLEAGRYDLTVTNPDNISVTVTEAFTVENVINVWSTGGPYGGLVGDIAVHPAISSTAFAVVAEVGVYKTENGGDWWENVFPGRLLNFVVITDHDLPILYVGDQGHTTAGGLYRSFDLGLTWRKVFTGYVTALEYSDSHPDNLYLGVDNSVRISQDLGDSWLSPGESLPTYNPVIAIAVHPITQTTIYAGTNDGRLYKSEDGAASWINIAPDLIPEWPDEAGAIDLFIDPSNPDHMFYTCSSPGAPFHRSLDGGDTWLPMSLDFPGNLSEFAYSGDVTGTIYGIACWGVFKSENDGESWQHLSIQPDCMWTLGLDPITNLPLYAGGGSQGVFKYADQGYTFTIKTSGIEGLQPWTVSAAPGHPQYVYSGAGSAGGFSSTDGGAQWDKVDTEFLDSIDASVVNPHDACEAYLTGFLKRVYTTTNCGITWSQIPVLAAYDDVTFPTIAVNPYNSTNLMMGGFVEFPGISSGVIFSSTRSGEDWDEIVLEEPVPSISKIIYDPFIPGRVYAATGVRWSYREESEGVILRSDDNGLTWDKFTEGLNGSAINTIVAHPGITGTLYAGISGYVYHDYSVPGGIYKSTDWGESWQKVSENFDTYRITELVFDPLDSGVLFAGTLWGGLFRSLDGGVSWEKPWSSFADASVFSLASSVNENDELGTLYVGMVGGAVQGDIVLSEMEAAAEQVIYKSGVFQITFVKRELYLPMIAR